MKTIKNAYNYSIENEKNNKIHIAKLNKIRYNKLSKRKGGLYMSSTLAVAKYLNELNLHKHGCNMDEMKMHKMMYLSQRESLMITDNPLFNDSFEAWKFGPVLRNVRNEYKHGEMFKSVNETLTDEEKKLVSSVFERYDSFDAWDLSSLSHEEFSWKQAREGLAPNENGTKKLSLHAMRVDAKREMLRRKGVVLA